MIKLENMHDAHHLVYASQLKCNNIKSVSGSGGTIPSTSYKSVFPAVISMVLALFLFQLHKILHEGNFLLSCATIVFWLGQAEGELSIHAKMSEKKKGLQWKSKSELKACRCFAFQIMCVVQVSFSLFLSSHFSLQGK